ncbi:GNAT family N-acetyltransferase [Mycolicibacterium sp. P9-22]|uniref:GNAT family N-acetyltransferase n=1 Tax=Mycolicibacterium sp. P9-22 TaxID=2024613 RepID=UPI0011EE64F7|nr:GNAT family N-acetyltransferase [Mycolicibacterium sp. P9-22]KAA0112823.1 GNAT family N-acetyltransferase [Mycolicibacterium sp. P9-22]
MQTRRATAADRPAVQRLVDAAFTPYIERIGRPPGPMTADYARALADSQVWVVDGDGRLDAVMVLEEHAGHLLIDVIAVDPAAQGRGVGAMLLGRAEADARDLGLTELRLYTNEAMTENLQYYPRRGFEETGRRIEDGFRRVYYRKAVVPQAL